MPCYDPRTDPNSEISLRWKKEQAEKYGTSDPCELRDMLCRTLTICNLHFDNLNLFPLEIREWYEKHKRWDQETRK